MYRLSEKEISATVSDFITFCQYIDKKKPILSKTKGVLGKNALFEINSLLCHKKEVSLPNHQQESYPVIDLIFSLALQGKLYIKVADEKGKLYLTRTIRKEEFDTLNIYEKYAFLLETFWTKYDFDEIMKWSIDSNCFDQVIQIIAESNPGEQLEKGAFSQNIQYDLIFSYLSIIIRQLNYFCVCKYVPIAEISKKISRYDDSIKTIIPTEYGVNICKILREHKIVDWNVSFSRKFFVYENNIIPGSPNQPEFDTRSFIMDKQDAIKAERLYNARKKSGFRSLYKYLQPVFPEGVLNNTVTSVINKKVKGSYLFKVSLGKGVWCKIGLSFEHTLEDLHNGIQKAFNFDDDHLYSFFMDARKYSLNAYHSPLGYEGPFVDEVKIGELELYEGQRILYLFDYGDSWEFEVQLLKINENELPPKKPHIIEIEGEIPKQYLYEDEEDM